LDNNNKKYKSLHNEIHILLNYFTSRFWQYSILFRLEQTNTILCLFWCKEHAKKHTSMKIRFFALILGKKKYGQKDNRMTYANLGFCISFAGLFKIFINLGNAPDGHLINSFISLVIFKPFILRTSMESFVIVSFIMN